MNKIFYEDFDDNDLVLIFDANINLDFLRLYLFIMITIYDLIHLVDMSEYYSKIKQCNVVTIKLSNLPF